MTGVTVRSLNPTALNRCSRPHRTGLGSHQGIKPTGSTGPLLSPPAGMGSPAWDTDSPHEAPVSPARTYSLCHAALPLVPP